MARQTHKEGEGQEEEVAKLIATEPKRQAKLIKEAAKSAPCYRAISAGEEASFRKENGSFSRKRLAAAPAAEEQQPEAGGSDAIAPNSSLQNTVDSSPAPDQVLAGRTCIMPYACS